MIIRDNMEYIRVLLQTYDTTVTGWGVHLLHSNVLNHSATNRVAAKELKLLATMRNSH